MLYWLLVPLSSEYFFFFNVFRYITVRTAAAGITALLLSFLFGPGSSGSSSGARSARRSGPTGPKSHFAKKGTPSMGGLLIILCTHRPDAPLGQPGQHLRLGRHARRWSSSAWSASSTTSSRSAGNSPSAFGPARRSSCRSAWRRPGRPRLHLDGLARRVQPESSTSPSSRSGSPYLGWFYLPWIVFILVGSSNAVNLADGLDGLAIGLTLISATALTALTYVAGHALWSEYLSIARVPQAAELTVFVGAFAGACLGFLWFNCHPAQVFMGDVGALSLGGTMAVIALLIKQEFLLFTVAGVFILEALSVLLQVSYFKLSGGKRIFKMAPLHHHFELSGWPEEQVVIRFWILGIIFALFSLSTLKLR